MQALAKTLPEATCFLQPTSVRAEREHSPHSLCLCRILLWRDWSSAFVVHLPTAVWWVRLCYVPVIREIVLSISQVLWWEHNPQQISQQNNQVKAKNLIICFGSKWREDDVSICGFVMFCFHKESNVQSFKTHFSRDHSPQTARRHYCKLATTAGTEGVCVSVFCVQLASDWTQYSPETLFPVISLQSLFFSPSDLCTFMKLSTLPLQSAVDMDNESLITAHYNTRQLGSGPPWLTAADRLRNKSEDKSTF